MSAPHEKNRRRFELVPSLVALVLSLAVTFAAAYGFATSTGAKAVQAYDARGIIAHVQAVH